MTIAVELPRINQSQVKSWRSCEQKWDYQYGQGLIPRRTQRPLHIGTWVHACLEGHYRDGDWRVEHAKFVADYNRLFEEERLALDDGPESLPNQVARIMRSYLWYRRNEGWKVIAVEQEFEVPMTYAMMLTQGVRPPENADYIGHALYEVVFIFKGRIDLIVEDPDGLRWVVDHKTTDKIPPQGAFHAMEPQLILYPWAIEVTAGIKTAGVIYNYLRSSPPTIPSLNKDGSISKRPIATDYPTAVTFLRDNGKYLADYSDYLLPMKDDSPFLARYMLPREDVVTQQVLRETMTTARAILGHEGITRNVSLQCDWCAYRSLCRAELFGLDTQLVRQRDYRTESAESAVEAPGQEV